jgi:hypothetical protein
MLAFMWVLLNRRARGALQFDDGDIRVPQQRRVGALRFEQAALLVDHIQQAQFAQLERGAYNAQVLLRLPDDAGLEYVQSAFRRDIAIYGGQGFLVTARSSPSRLRRAARTRAAAASIFP